MRTIIVYMEVKGYNKNPLNYLHRQYLSTGLKLDLFSKSWTTVQDVENKSSLSSNNLTLIFCYFCEKHTYMYFALKLKEAM